MPERPSGEVPFRVGDRHSSWESTGHAYRDRDIEAMAMRYAPDALSMPANHPALRGRDQVRAWYARRVGDFDMHSVSEIQSVDVIGEIAVTSGIFRVTRAPEDGVAGLDHGGRFLSVHRRIDGRWYLWRDMDTPSPDGDVFYGRLARGQ